MNHQELVREFHDAFGVVCPKKPTMPDKATRALRCKLILEESFEFLKACGFGDIEFLPGLLLAIDNELTWHQYREPNLKEMSDALADIEYVTHGANEACGIDGDPVFREAHRSNMSKQWLEVETLSYKAKDLIFTENESGCFVAKNAAGKVIKSPGYSKADIAGELIKQGASL